MVFKRGYFTLGDGCWLPKEGSHVETGCAWATAPAPRFLLGKIHSSFGSPGRCCLDFTLCTKLNLMMHLMLSGPKL